MFAGMKSCIIVGILTLLLANLGFGNEFRYLKTENGLTDGEINSIVQDSTGNMWFATWSGLIRYDGYYFENFRPELGDSLSLPEKKIKTLYVDSKDNLWIGSSMNLSRFNKHHKTFHTYRFQDVTERGINIYNLSEVDEHLVVHAVEGIFLIPFSEINNTDYVVKKYPVSFSGKPYHAYFNYSTSFENKLVLVTNSNGSGSRICFASIKNDHNGISLDISKVLDLNDLINDIVYVPVENTMYIATTHGLVPYSMGKEQFVKTRFFRNYDIQQIYYASNHRIYASLPEPKLLYLDLHTGMTGIYESNPNIAGSLLDNEIHTIYEDFSGNLWIGHQGQGISIKNIYQKKFRSFRRDPFRENSLNSNTVMCFEGTENEIIIGCRNNGLNIIPKKQTSENELNYQTIPLKAKESPGIINDGIWDMAKQSDSLIWVGTEMGLYSLSKTKAGWKMEPFKGTPAITHSIRKIFIDTNNNLWLGSHGFGLFFIPNLKHNPTGMNYRFEASSTEPNSLSDNVILDIFLDSKKRFWIGTNNGLNRLRGDYENLDLSGKAIPDLKFKQYVAKKPSGDFLNNNEINCFFENFDGTIWIATQGGGINIWNPDTDKFSFLTTEDGLPSDDVISILPDEDGNLWISTSHGLTRYNRFVAEPYFTVFDPSDGIQGETFMVNSFYKAADGQMFFGGDKGFTCFYPREIQINLIKPKIWLTHFRIRNRIIEIGDTLYRDQVLEKDLNEISKLVLPYESNNFSIGVSALHFQHPQNNSITYILEGLFDTWYTVRATSRYVYLSNIPPGTYTFRARTISSDNILSDEEKSMVIEIKPPWYRTFLAIFLYSILVITLAGGFIYILINRQRLIYQKKIDKMTIENNENKMMFLTNIAHELRTPLSLIIAPVEDLMRTTNMDGQGKNHLHLISRNSNYLLRLINQIIDFRKLNAGKLLFQPRKADIVRVVKDVVMNFKGYESARNINLQVKLPAESVIFYFDVQKIEEVLYNLISNAFKHTFDDHSITVSLNFQKPDSKEGQESVVITVFNEGKEIDEVNRSKIFERFYKVNDNSEGAGIGLAFAKSLVEMHNGTIEVESAPGKGVVFHVVLPVNGAQIVKEEIVIHDTEKILPEMPVENGSQVAAGFTNGNHAVLIVEDNVELGKFLEGVLARNYKCFYAANGLEALKMLQKISPSVIITDVIMPGMDGLELCRKIKENRETCHIPVLLLTAKDTPEQITEGYAVGADAYITKPFEMKLLLSQTARLIQNRDLIREKYRTQNFMVEVENRNTSRDSEFVQTIKRILETNISDPEFNVNKLSRQLNISTTQLYRRLKELTGYSPVEFIRIIKLQKAFSLLNKRNNTVKEVCYLTGFNNMSYFIKCFREKFGVTPAYFRDNGLPEKIADKMTDIVHS